jgi:hypothetical protein
VVLGEHIEEVLGLGAAQEQALSLYIGSDHG